MSLPLLAGLLLAASPGVYSVTSNSSSVCGKTPMTLQEDFNASCLALVNNGSTCNMAWDAFQGAFAGHGVDPQDVQASDYGPYFDILPIEASPNQSLFWSRTSSLVEILSMMNAMVTVVSSANTVPSEVINNIKTVNNSRLSWCGSTDGGIDFENNCSCNVTGQFWTQFSLEFSQVATGNAFYLTDGEDASGAYRNDSFFAKVELPNVNITRLIALVIHRKGKGESCGETSSTIQTLRETVRNRFDFDCYDIYGQASNSSMSQSEKIASCVASVVDAVQRGTEGTKRQIDCIDVSSGVTVQVSLVLLLTVHIMYWLI